MDQRKMCFESFTEESFEALVNGLTSEGYVIDGRETSGVPFSSTQIEHLDQDVFDQLCSKFNRSTDLKLFGTGKFFSAHGAYYIIYDTDALDLDGARQLLNDYVNGLPID